jgi:hypothetical protein
MSQLPNMVNVIDPVTNTAAANLSSASGNMTRLAETRMGINARASELEAQMQHDLEMQTSSQQFQGQQDAQRQQAASSMQESQQAFVGQESEKGRQHDKALAQLEEAHKSKWEKYNAARQERLFRMQTAIEQNQIDQAAPFVEEMGKMDDELQHLDHELTQKQFIIGKDEPDFANKVKFYTDTTQKMTQSWAQSLIDTRNKVDEAVRTSVSNLLSSDNKEYQAIIASAPKDPAQARASIATKVVNDVLSRMILPNEGADPSLKSDVARFFSEIATRSTMEGGFTAGSSQALTEAKDKLKGRIPDEQLDSLLQAMGEKFSGIASNYASNAGPAGLDSKTREHNKFLFQTLDSLRSFNMARPLLGIPDAQKTMNERAKLLPGMFAKIQQALGPEALEAELAKLDPETRNALEPQIRDLLSTQSRLSDARKSVETLTNQKAALRTQQAQKLRAKPNRKVITDDALQKYPPIPVPD